MTNEARVKSVYPHATIARLQDPIGRGARFWVYSDPAMGKTQLLSTARRADWAWAEAARKIQGEKSGVSRP